MKENLLLQFEKLSKRGVHQETTDFLEDSFFSEIYQQAYRAVKSIVNANEKVNHNKQEYYSLYNTQNIQNVISFTGRRGTGKTSAMLTFANALNYGNYTDLPYFYVIPCIDVAILNENEDMFDVILSNMLLALNMEIDKKRITNDLSQNTMLYDLQKDMCNMFNQYNRLKYSSNEEDIFSYNTLIDTARKHNIRDNFAKLVMNYMSFMHNINSKSHYIEKNSSYLVICIDDIDMADRNYMDILKCIYQYLMIPNIVVLTAFNSNVLKRLVEKHFYAIFSKSNFNNDNIIIKEDSIEQTYDFLRKICSSDMRITMPSWKRMDYRELTQFDIILEDKEHILKIFSRLTSRNFLVQYIEQHQDENSTQISLSPKKLIMFMLADRTSIYLDGNGLKLHFMEPDSLRNLYDLFYFLYNMEDIRSNPNNKENFKYVDENWNNTRTNYKILLDYFHFKMIHELGLNDEEYYIIKNFHIQPIDRRGQKIFDYYKKTVLLIKKSEKHNISKKLLEKLCDNKSYYSYGELLHIIYISSRAEILSKNFIKAVLASYSFILPYDFLEYTKIRKTKENITENEIKDLKKKFYTIFSDSLLGSFNDILLPKNKVIIKFDDNSMVETILLLMLQPSIDQNIEVIDISEKEITINIDPTAFVMNTFQYETFFTKIKEKLKEENSNLQNIIENLTKIFKKYDERIYFALPLQHTDLVYSIIKRAAFRTMYIDDFSLKTKESNPNVLDLLKEIYFNIYRELKDVDKFYNFKSKEHQNFTNRFISCPLVYFILQKKLESDENEDLNEDFHNLYKSDNKSTQELCELLKHMKDNGINLQNIEIIPKKSQEETKNGQ